MIVFRALLGATKAVATVVTVIAVAVVPPVAWIWIGSQVQGGTAPSGTAIVTVIAGLIVSYMFIALVIVWLVSRSGMRPRGPTRYAWNRSLRDERHQSGRTTHVLEDVFVAAAVLVTIIVAVWFFGFGNPGVPVTP
jgi:uncharacterized membrane protein